MIPLTKALNAPRQRRRIGEVTEIDFGTLAPNGGIGICSHSGAEYGVVCPQGTSSTTRANSEPVRLASYDTRLIAAAPSPGIPQAEL